MPFLSNLNYVHVDQQARYIYLDRITKSYLKFTTRGQHKLKAVHLWSFVLYVPMGENATT